MHDALTDRLAAVSRSQIGMIDIVAGSLSFWAHHTYVDRLENVWAGGVVSVGGWGSLITSLIIEWSDSNLLVSFPHSVSDKVPQLQATVILSLVASADEQTKFGNLNHREHGFPCP
jgi:hypothetical protein